MATATNRYVPGYKGYASYRIPQAHIADSKRMFVPIKLSIETTDIASSLIRIHGIDTSWKYHKIRIAHTATNASLVFNFVLVPADSTNVASTIILPSTVTLASARPVLSELTPNYGLDIYTQPITGVYSALSTAGTEVYAIRSGAPTDLAIQISTATTAGIELVVSSEWWPDGVAAQ